MEWASLCLASAAYKAGKGPIIDFTSSLRCVAKATIVGAIAKLDI